ncbi:MAG: hypothetical protein A2X36_04830 [Elusimicrobia bacterium GWA2_69_24]|nr:MAG: hypothetical protein A2X36_04830 [Elusimicrobia bacterium GWA2_69_24]
MARGLRDVFPGDITHVFNRGNGKLEIFLDEKDYLRFLQTLERAVSRFKCKVYSHCLLPTHFHLLIQTGNVDISRVMHWIQTSYAMYYNRRHGHRGHLFQGRFGSSTCGDDGYFFELLRYINLNSVKHGYADDPADWRWSSHQSLCQGLNSALLDAETPLSYFDADLKKAASRYALHIDDWKAGCRNGPDPVEVAMKLRKSTGKERSYEPAKIIAPVELEEIAESVSAETGVEPQTLRGPDKSHHAATARRLLAARATALGHRSAHIAAFLNRANSTVAWYLDVVGPPDLGLNFLGPGP